MQRRVMQSKQAPLKILVTGRDGQLGFELSRSCASLGDVASVSRRELDLSSDFKKISEYIQNLKPDIILNAAAYTAVDRAEVEQDLNIQVNANCLNAISSAADKVGACIVHYSTDYVFGGDASQPYSELHKTNPINSYGAAKKRGEEILQKSGVPHLIFRTSWVYGLRGKNFLLTMRKLALEKEEIGVVADQIGSPTWVRSIAEATAQVMAQARAGDFRDFFERKSGIYHLTCGGKTSWYDFAKKIFELDPQKSKHLLKNLKAIRTEDYKTPAKRPAFSVLDNSLFEKTFRLKMPNWETALALVMQELV